MPVILTLDVPPDGGAPAPSVVAAKVELDRLGEYITLTPAEHNIRKLVLAMARRLVHDQTRADFMRVALTDWRTRTAITALDRLVNEATMRDACTWALSPADADQLGAELGRLS